MSEEMILASKDALVCPRGRAGGSPLVLDLRGILEAEARQAEVQSVTKEKSGELQKVFNECWRKLNENLAQLEYELDQAKNYVEEVAGDIIIDVVPEVLKKHGLKDSVDVRKAITGRQQSYRDALERVNHLTAIVKFIATKAKSFERAHQTVRSLTSSGSGWQPGSLSVPYSNPSSTADDGGWERSPEPTKAPSVASGFGTPRY